MKRSPQYSVKGFTLIEVMLAAAIMLAGIVGAIQVLVSGSEMLETSRTQAVALQIIDSELAAVRMASLSGSWATNKPTALQNGSSLLNLSAKYPASSYPNFQSVINLLVASKCTRTVSFAQSRTDFKQVTVTLTWTNHEGRQYTRSGITYVGKNGLYVSYQR